MGWSPWKEAEKKAKQAVDKIIKPAAQKVEKEVKGVGEKAVNEVRSKGRWYIKEVEKKGKGALSEVDKVKDKAVKEVKEEAEEAVKMAFDALSKAITKEGLELARKIVKTTKNRLDKFAESEEDYTEEINNIDIGFDLGPFSLSYDSFYDRSQGLVDTLDVFINKPPAFRRSDIKRLIEALGPSSIGVSGSVNLAALVASSEELGVGVSVGGFRSKLIALIVDDILEALNVPK